MYLERQTRSVKALDRLRRDARAGTPDRLVVRNWFCESCKRLISVQASTKQAAVISKTARCSSDSSVGCAWHEGIL